MGTVRLTLRQRARFFDAGLDQNDLIQIETYAKRHDVADAVATRAAEYKQAALRARWGNNESINGEIVNMACFGFSPEVVNAIFDNLPSFFARTSCNRAVLGLNQIIDIAAGVVSRAEVELMARECRENAKNGIPYQHVYPPKSKIDGDGSAELAGAEKKRAP